jgi:toxin ParE1/3/4
LRIRWTKDASKDLESIEEYIRQDNPWAAVQQVLRVIDAVEQSLAENPRIGRPGRVSNTREFYVTGTPYIAAYRIIEDTLEVLRVIHGARRWPKKM